MLELELFNLFESLEPVPRLDLSFITPLPSLFLSPLFSMNFFLLFTFVCSACFITWLFSFWHSHYR